MIKVIYTPIRCYGADGDYYNFHECVAIKVMELLVVIISTKNGTADVDCKCRGYGAGGEDYKSVEMLYTLYNIYGAAVANNS